MTLIRAHAFDTAFGRIHTAATGDGLAIICLPGGDSADLEKMIARLFPRAKVGSEGLINRQAEAQITAYSEGRLTSFDLQLDLRVTPFQQRALAEVVRIPYGRVATYGEIATALGQPTAARAVGNANANNPLPLVIPCHRVVAQNGLGGYAGGLELKQRLLDLEGAQ